MCIIIEGGGVYAVHDLAFKLMVFRENLDAMAVEQVMSVSKEI